MKQETKKFYQAPKVLIVPFKVENGFAGSDNSLENLNKSTDFNIPENSTPGNEEVGNIFGGSSF